ncbi:MAG: SurA N-terminal domain-containing protein [Henriciella sp.]|nr:SurA N-terminal domain-containing protein [Henriciella sp.]
MFKRLASSIAIIAFGAFSSLALAQEEAQPENQQLEGIVAVVNDVPVSFSDVRQRARLLLLSLGTGQQPTPEQIAQLTNQALNQLIDEKLQLQEAAEYEVEVTDTDIAGAIERLAQSSGLTRESLNTSLLQSGVNPTSLEDQTRADIAWRRIMGGLYGSRIRISDNQISGQIDRLKAASAKEQYQVSEIFLYAPLETDKVEVLNAANSIIEQLNAGAPFDVAAQRFSSAPTAATGGDMGWVTLDDLDDARSEALRTLNGPGLTQPVQVDDGIYIMNVRNKRDPSEKATVVDLTRVTVVDGLEASLLAGLEKVEGCNNITEIVEADENLDAAVLTGLNVDQLGPEGKSMVMATKTGERTDIFAQSGTLAVMYVCDRQDNVDALPDRDQIEDRLYSEQLGMVSERALRNLRREATIIRR